MLSYKFTHEPLYYLISTDLPLTATKPLDAYLSWPLR
jgi:hypothetical protein